MTEPVIYNEMVEEQPNVLDAPESSVGWDDADENDEDAEDDAYDEEEFKDEDDEESEDVEGSELDSE